MHADLLRNSKLPLVQASFAAGPKNAKCKQAKLKLKEHLSMSMPDGICCLQAAGFKFCGRFEVTGTPCPVAYSTVLKEFVYILIRVACWSSWYIVLGKGMPAAPEETNTRKLRQKQEGFWTIN